MSHADAVGGPSRSTSTSSGLTLDALASPPLYTEAEHSSATDAQLAIGQPSSLGAAAVDNAQAPSYQASAQGGDTTVLGGPPLGSGAVRARDGAAEQDDTFFDIAPSSDATSFQVGYLGLDGFQAWIKGDVLLKLGSITARQRASFYKCIIELRAVESVDADSAVQPSAPAGGETNEVELFYSSLTLWDATAATSSTAPPSELPKTMPFSFPLTHDLPHCVHLPRSRLAYTLRATLHSGDLSATRSLIKIVPVHLSRYSAPGDLTEAVPSGSAGDAEDFGSNPHTWRTSTPTEIYAQLERTLYRRSEPMSFRVLIPALPDRRLMTEKSLHLRAVEADLIRIITVLPPGGAEALSREAGTKAKEKGKLAEGSIGPVASTSRSAVEEGDGERVPSYAASMAAHAGGAEEEEAQAGPSTQASTRNPSTPFENDPSQSSRASANQYETLLAHSGKLCRFSTHRAVNLRLTLHPPFSAPNMPHPHPDHDAFAVAARSATMYVRSGTARDSGSGGVAGSSSADGGADEGGDASRGAGVETAAPGSLAGGTGCESITQETLLHKVRFEVRVRVALDGGPAGRRDVRFVREVCILPGAAGEAVDDRRLRDGEAITAQDGNLDADSQAPGEGQSSAPIVPPRAPEKRAARGSQTASTSEKQAQLDGIFANFNDDEEYDGYEDVLQDVDSDDLPPAADDPGETSFGTVASIPFLGAGPSSAGGSSAEHAQAVTRSAESEEPEPPPTLQESQHDLQVEEVEVEGVGFAVPRRRMLHGSEDTPGFYDTFAPPPVVVPADAEVYRFRSGGSDTPPPPPPSPPPPALAAREISSDFPPPPPETAPPSESHGSSGSGQGQGQEQEASAGVVVAHEPPPYLDEARSDRPPSFHAQSQIQTAVGGGGGGRSGDASRGSPVGRDSGVGVGVGVGAGVRTPDSRSPPAVLPQLPPSVHDEAELRALPPAYAQPPHPHPHPHPPRPPTVPVRTSSSSLQGPPSYSLR
ncbi:hypothetical protein OC835_004781 [Tilletia horrida]|nr:hypothetical protein OC835_004781 [Tilletia horrida]